MRAKWMVFGLLMAVTLGAVVLHAQEPRPTEAFKTVHLVTLTPAQEATLLAALADVNASVAQAGHPDIRYRLYKVTGRQAGNFSHMWESSWPSGAVYRSSSPESIIPGGDKETSTAGRTDEDRHLQSIRRSGDREAIAVPCEPV